MFVFYIVVVWLILVLDLFLILNMAFYILSVVYPEGDANFSSILNSM